MTSYFFLWSYKNNWALSTHSPGLGCVIHYRRPRRLDRPQCRCVQGFPLHRRPLQQGCREPMRRRARLARSFLLLICLVRGSGLEQLTALGDPDGASRQRVEFDGTTGPWTLQSWQGSSARRQSTTAPSRRYTPSITGGLVRALSERALERQQSWGGSSRRRSLHGGGPSVLPRWLID